MPDLSIPENLPTYLQNQLNELVDDFTEENLTLKGYQNKRKQLLDNYARGKSNPLTPVKSQVHPQSVNHSRTQSCNSTIRTGHSTPHIGDDSSIASSINRSRNGDLDSMSPALHASQQHNRETQHAKTPQGRHHSLYRVTTVNSNSDYSSPSSRRKRSSIQLSLPSNEITGVPYNPMVPLLPRQEHPVAAESLPSIVRGRFDHYSSETAFISINEKGKETSISWDRLYLRAEKIAYVLSKEKLYKMDKIPLWYNRNEVIEFTIALLGCFIAGMVAVPVSFETYSVAEITEIIKLTNSKQILISNDCHNQLENLYSTVNHTKMKLTKNDFFSQINFIKTDDLGAYSKAKKTAPTFDIPNVSYIEFTRTPLGRLSGVVMKHKILSYQYKTLAGILNSRVLPHWKKNEINRSPHKKDTCPRYTILNSLDPTRSTGLILGVLFNIFSGNLLVSIDYRILQKPGGYENIINKFRADILLNDQLQLKQVVINYLDDPQSTFSKKQRINFGCIKCCLTSCTTIDTDVSDMVVNKWLKNLGCPDAPMCYSPMLTLLDFGGVFLSLRDQIGKLDNFQIHCSKLRLEDELFVNKENLRSNIIQPSVSAIVNSSNSFNEYLRVAAYGFPIPDATLCVVNPDDNTLVSDLTVGEIWVHSDSLTNEFYQMDRVNDFVFKAKLNYQKMYNFLLEQNNSSSALERLDTIMTICPSSLQFLRTKLIGFIHNGKIYVLSMVEDMFLQNQLIRLPNWSHTSDVSRAKISTEKPPPPTRNSTIGIRDKKRVVQTYYLHQITETLVRTVNTVSEVSAFELNHNKEEHFLAVVIESSMARPAATALISAGQNKNEVLEKRMNELTEQVYRILWIFHKIQPMCVVVVPQGSLPRRYCSLELANSTVEKKFLNGELPSTFVKFQMDNITLDFVPHSLYFNESIFSEHLSNLRSAALKETQSTTSLAKESQWQISGIDYRETSIDVGTGKRLTDFPNILDILEWRMKNNSNDSAFDDGGDNNASNNENNIHKRVSWSSFECIIASFLKKIIGSKSPLKRGDRVLIMSENSVEYVAIVMACFYCKFVVIPYPILREKYAEKDVEDFCNVVKAYGIKRIFTDAKTYNFFDGNVPVSKVLKKNKHVLPKITVFTKVKRKTGLSISIFKKYLKANYSSKPGTNSNAVPCIVWINREYDIKSNIHVTMTHSAFMNSCKMLKETLQLSPDRPLFSLCSYTTGIGFMMSCLLGIYVGCTTSLFSLSEVTLDPKEFLIGLQNLNVKDLFLRAETLCMLVEKANNLISLSRKNTTVSKKGNTTLLRPDLFRNVQNFMIPFSGRPNIYKIEGLIKKNTQVILSPVQINYVYENHFNPHITLRSYLGIPPVDLYLDPISLREGLIKTVDPSTVDTGGYLRVQDSGIVPVCTDVSIVNPETNMTCYNGEFGEIWCCSEGNAFNYSICAEGENSGKRILTKDPFINEQFNCKLKKDVDNGLSYLRTGDLGFIKSVSCPDAYGNVVDLNLLFVLGSINETVEILGLTHFVEDLERTVMNLISCFENCMISKAGGLLVCLVECRGDKQPKMANLTALIVSELLKNHGVILDLCAFVKHGTITNFDWNKNRATLMKDWFNQKLIIENQFGVNFGENISIYLLSEFEKQSQ